jgi:demethylmenaquinone methyltransferase/2-methoxy-6-polyprenyl-1,4-benzoquinol methylase
MTNEFYNPGEQRAAKVGALFATIARRYDRINDIQSFGIHRLWKRRVLHLAHPQPAERALDLCCGTGDITLALAKCGAHVTGLDFSEPMLEVAREKLARIEPLNRDIAQDSVSFSSPKGGEGRGEEALRVHGEVLLRAPGKNRLPGGNSNPNAQSEKSCKPKIEFIRGDAQQIPFPENSFDILTIGYGLRNLADLDAGLRDMLRVTKPGGRIVALEFGKPANRAWRSIYFTYLKFALPIFGKLFVGNSAAYGYILESLTHYPGQQTVAEKMGGLGWQKIRVFNLMGGIMSIHYAEKPI